MAVFAGIRTIEVLEFIEQISASLDSDVEEMKNAQMPTMKRIWENREDDVWNDM